MSARGEVVEVNEYQSVPHQMTKGDIASFARPATPIDRYGFPIFISVRADARPAHSSNFCAALNADNLLLGRGYRRWLESWPAMVLEPAQNEVVNEIVAWQRRGTRVVFMPGNHDQIGLIESLLGISPQRGELIHVTASGCRMLVTHGHQFDSSFSSARWLPLMGSKAYAAALRINEWYCRECFGPSATPVRLRAI